MKKLITVFIIISIIFIGNRVYAEDYYTNRKGVSFTKEQYDFYTDLMHDGYQEIVTQEMLDDIDWDNLDSLTIQKTSLCPMPTTERVPLLRDDNTYVSTSAKSLMMANICAGDICRIYSNVEWYGIPNQQSYDLIGAFLDGPTRNGNPMVMISTEDDFDDEELVKYETDGFGAIVQVLDGEGLMIDMTFSYSGHGGIFVSYQHAMSAITLANAQLFNIDFIGYGNVFDFYGAAIGVYDEMPGVHMDV